MTVENDSLLSTPSRANLRASNFPSTPSPVRHRPRPATTLLPVPTPSGRVSGTDVRTPIRSYTMPPPQPQDRHQIIYSHEREIYGVIKTFYDRPATTSRRALPSLTPAADSYLTSHGYTIEAILLIAQAFSYCHDVEDFVRVLSSEGAVVSEMEYLWSLLSPDNH